MLSYGAMSGLDVRRKNATRESTSTLKAWLFQHIKNPYPTKGEKIMLAIVTRMTLTQVIFLYTRPFNGHFCGTTRVSRHQKGKTNLDFTEARDSEWQWHHLGHMQVCTSLQRDNHVSTPLLSFLEAGCPSCCPTNSVKALKATLLHTT